jgi:hypothetical protein
VLSERVGGAVGQTGRQQEIGQEKCKHNIKFRKFFALEALISFRKLTKKMILIFSSEKN